MAVYGYARISTSDQNLSGQRMLLKQCGCERIFEDTITGASDYRPGLNEMLKTIVSGDTVVVYRLDRLARSMVSLLRIVNELQSRGVEFKSLSEHLDTSSAGGVLIFHVLGALSEFGRSLIRENTAVGLAAARARGRFGGRPKLLKPDAAQVALELHEKSELPISEICKTLNVSRATFYRALKQNKARY